MKPLTNSKVTVTGDGFVTGEGATYNVTGSQKWVGSSDNEFTYTLMEGTKAANYNITTKFGLLKVTMPADLDIVTKSHEDAIYELGDTVTFSIVVFNIFDGEAEFTVEEKTGVTFKDGTSRKTVTLGAGESTTLTATYTIQEADVLGGFTNLVKVPSITVNGERIEGSDSDTDTVDVKDKYNVTVRYIYKDGTKAAADKSVTVQYKAAYSIASPDIKGYTPDKTVVEGTMGTEDVEETVTYTVRSDLTYTVNYYEQGTINKVANSKVVENVIFGTDVTEKAINVPGYRALDPKTQTITIDVEKNVIDFFYARRTDLTYTVYYYLNDTQIPVAAAKTVGGKTLGQKVTEEAIAVAGYIALDPTEKAQEIGPYNEDNYIIFYYAPVGGFTYTVRYLEQGTNRTLANARTVGGQVFGTVVTENAIDIDGYNAVAPTTRTIAIGNGGNEITFYYTARTDLSYTVNYLEQGSDKVLADAKTVNGQTLGAIVTEDAIDIEGYDKVNPSSASLTIGTGENVINFYYTPSDANAILPVDVENITDDDTPLAQGGAWALVNLILTILTALGSVLLLLGYLGKKNKEATDEDGNVILDENGEATLEYTLKKKGFWRLFSLVPAIVAIIVFILTENMRLPMVLVDRWTLLMLVIALVQVAVAFFSKKKKEEPEEEEQTVNA